ncbi:hypothetical protein ACVWZM_008430 [Bradyrhizobium sp. USDA 4501]
MYSILIPCCWLSRFRLGPLADLPLTTLIFALIAFKPSFVDQAFLYQELHGLAHLGTDIANSDAGDRDVCTFQFVAYFLEAFGLEREATDFRFQASVP